VDAIDTDFQYWPFRFSLTGMKSIPITPEAIEINDVGIAPGTKRDTGDSCKVGSSRFPACRHAERIKEEGQCTEDKGLASAETFELREPDRLQALIANSH
jgi:hypothetical protein